MAQLEKIKLLEKRKSANNLLHAVESYIASNLTTIAVGNGFATVAAVVAIKENTQYTQSYNDDDKTTKNELILKDPRINQKHFCAVL